MKPPFDTTHRPTKAEIDLKALRNNFGKIRNRLSPKTQIMAIVKADAYGHGAVRCSKEFANAGADSFGVATLEEAIELRDNNIDLPILCLGGVWPGQEDAFLFYGITPVICDLDQATRLNSAAKVKGITVPVHIKIDSGMGRIGILPNELIIFFEGLRRCKNLELEGVMTHFAAADSDEGKEFTVGQVKKFDECLATVYASGFTPAFIHAKNSPASLTFVKEVGNMVRPGGALYGLTDDMLPESSKLNSFKPILTLKTNIAYVKKIPAGSPVGYARTYYTKRDSLIAALPIGYSDGYPRSLSNKTNVIINSEYAPVIGRISMDWTLIDVTDIENPETGNEVILIGNDSEKSISVFDISSIAKTISYEITCGFTKRIPRVYIN